MLSDQVNFYIQRVNPNPLIPDWINMPQFGYNTATLTSSFFMNNVDIMALIASKTIDLTNLRTTPTTKQNYLNSYGNPTAYFDDAGTLTTLGILNNSGGV